MGIIAKENSVGAWTFLIGVILAVVIGFSTSFIGLKNSGVIYYSTQIYAILIILGLIIGWMLKVSGKDAQTFMISGTVLVIVSWYGKESVTGSIFGIGIGSIVSSVFSALLVLFVPATIVVALKTLFGITRV